MSPFRPLRAVAVLAGLVLSVARAEAAPQILGVVAQAEPRPLICRNGDCVAYLSTFCIQQRRDAPTPGTRYRPAPAGLALIVTTAEGTRLSLPADPHVTFTTQGGYSAVRAHLSAAALARLGGVSAAIEIGAQAALVPEAVPGDPEPQSAQDISLATGPLRAAAQPLFDRAGGAAKADAARLTARLINALPERGPVLPEVRDSLWRTQVGDVHAGLSPKGVERARYAYGACRWLDASGHGQPLRGCLEATHDALMMDVNKDYWDSLGGV